MRRQIDQGLAVLLNEAAGDALLLRDYPRAAALLARAARHAVTPEGADVLQARSREARQLAQVS